MEPITIDIPVQEKHFIDQQVSERGFDSPSAFLLSLVREEQIRKQRERAEMEDFIGRSREDAKAGRVRPAREAIEALGLKSRLFSY